MSLRGTRAKDRRIEKTENLLRDSLISLIREKDYDSIAVKEILDRANVGRSTFYMHFRDKDELLVSGIHHMLGPVQSKANQSGEKPHEGFVRFSLPIFEYVDAHRHTSDARMGMRGRAIIHEHLRKVVAELIADHVKKASQGRRRTSGRIPPDLLVSFIASTFILVLNWWVERKSTLSPKDVNELFHAMILPTLAATLE
jgi:AcrR family transcriptional regulator